MKKRAQLLNTKTQLRMKVVFEIKKNLRWIDISAKIVRDFNNSRHRTIGMKPDKVNKR